MNGMDEMAEMNSLEGFRGLFEMGGGGRVAMPLCDRTVSGEVAVDATLPDYLPEIRRVLAVRADRMPPSQYAGGGKVEWSGTVDYRLLYVSAQGTLCSAPLSGTYDFEAPMEIGGREFDLNEGVCTWVSTATDSITTRLGGPRKVSLRHRLSSHVRAFGQMLMPDEGERSERICRLSAKTECMIPASGRSEDWEFEDSCPLPSEQARVITAEPTVFVSSVAVREGAVAVGGEIILKLLVEEGDGCQVLTRRIPFEGNVEGDFRADGSACAEGVVSELKVVAEEGMISCMGTLLLTARGFARESLSYTEDLYATDQECQCDTVVLEVPTALRCENRNFSQNERIPLSETNLTPDTEILDAWGEAKPEHREVLGDRMVLSGQVHYFMLCQREGDYSVCEVILPLRYESDVSGAQLCDAELSVAACRARIDGETLALDAELTLCADYTAAQSISCVGNVRLGEPYVRSANRMTVYYPVPGDTPWTVAKKYHVPMESLRGDIGSYFVL